MGIRRWFSRVERSDPPLQGSEPPQSVSNAGAVVVLRIDPVPMSGTTTRNAVAAGALFTSRGRTAGGLLELVGQLVPEPGNPVDTNAVAVHVEGERVGYLPGYLASQITLPAGAVAACAVQLWGAQDGDRLRVVGWVAAGPDPLPWPHTKEDPAAVTVAQQRTERAMATTDMVDEALTSNDPERVAQFRRGMVGRYHYLETVEPIQQLKREGRLLEALELCYGAIDAAERDRAGREPAAWYTEQAAIIHRKRGERDQEVAVLQRWLEACPPQRRDGSKIGQRLAKLQR